MRHPEPFRDSRFAPHVDRGKEHGGYPVGDPFADPYFAAERKQPPSLSLGRRGEERLGEILLRLGKLQARQLDQALVLQNIERVRLGEMLLKLRFIDQATLEEALRLQRESSLRPIEGNPSDPVAP